MNVLLWLCALSAFLKPAATATPTLREGGDSLRERQSTTGSQDAAAAYLAYQGMPAPFHLVASPPKGAPVVHIANGSFYGYTNAQDGEDYFFGIPYAQPVIGQNRFKQPQSLNSTWKGYRNTTNLGPACPTASTSNKKVWTMEDCLTLNVYRPAGTKREANLPIMIWFYGGGGIDGYSGTTNFTGLVRHAASKGRPFIGVTFNYRMLNWGFLASHELAMDGSLNLFLHDQRKLIQWVHENAKAFGGDPSRVTIAGISYGGISVGWQRLYGGGDGGHFSRAMQMSGSATSQMVRRHADGQAIFDELTSKTGCDQSPQVLTCLRSLPFGDVAAVFAASKLTLSGAVYYDADFFPRSPHDSLAQGLYKHVPTIIGDVRDEGTLFVGTPAPDTEAGLASLLRSTRWFPGPKLTNTSIARLLAAYPDDPARGAPFNGLDYAMPASFGGQWRRMAAISGDVGLGRARVYDARQYAAAVPTWAYRHETFPWNGGNRSSDLTYGVSHGSDGPFLFLDSAALGTDPAYVALAEAMALHTLNFLYTGDPNGRGGGVDGKTPAYHWPRYDPAKPTLLVRNATAAMPMAIVKDDVRVEAFAFLNSIMSELSV